MEIFAEDRSVFRFGHGVAQGYEPSVPARLAEFSLREGAAIVGPVEYGGCRLYALDMSRYSTTGTFKDWVAAATVAFCSERSIARIVSQSSGNTANALSRYCTEFGVEAAILYPKISRYKIRPPARAGTISLIEVDGSEAEVKVAIRELSESTGAPWLPNLDLQDIGNGFRADFVVAAERNLEIKFDWHVQALSSAFGPIAMYRRWAQMLGSGVAPRFLGIQQAAVAPFVQQIGGTGTSVDSEIIEPTLFRSTPTPDLIARMRAIRDAGGHLSTVTAAQFRQRTTVALALLRSLGVELQKANEAASGLLEAAPALATVGAMMSVDDGTIAEGSDVLLAVTGGTMSLIEPFAPVQVWRAGDGLEALKSMVPWA